MKHSQHKRILIVDDEQSLALTLKAIVEHYGYEAAIAFSGEEAIAAADTFVPDLLLSDIHMGGMNGIEAATRITAKLPNCRVLFLSGHIATSQRQLSSAKGFRFEVASKPVPPPQLMKRITEMLTGDSTGNYVVLTVMRDDILRYAIAAKLADAGFIVREARSGAEALDVIQGSTLAKTLADAGFYVKEVGVESASELMPPDAMVLEVLLPDTLGFEVHKAMVKFDPDFSRIPVIYLATEEHLSSAENEAASQRSAKVLALPVEPENVVSVLKSLLITNGTQLPGPSSAL